MELHGTYGVILEQGMAKKPFNTLTKEEINQLGFQVMEKVNQKALVHGLKPVVGTPEKGMAK